MPDDSNDGSTAFLRPEQAQAREKPREPSRSEALETDRDISAVLPAPVATASVNARRGPPRLAIPLAELPKVRAAPAPILATIPEQPLPPDTDEEQAVSSRGRELLTPEAAGRYLMKREFGRGGMSSIWLAFDQHIGREVAFKQLLPAREGARDGGTQAVAAQARFINEARITGQLEHPNIVPVYEVGRRPDGATYYTLKLVRGRTLTDALKGCRDLRERLGLLSHFVALCQAMAYAQKRGVIHRDIKPDNVMVGEFGETVVLDWGLARFLDRPAQVETDRDLSSTQEGDVMGTPAYMSPEQAMGANDQVDHQSDVWSLGAVLFEIVTGRPPFQGRNLMQMLMTVAKEKPPPVRSVEPKAPPELAAIVERALTREKPHRYPSAAALVADVEAWRTGGRVSVFKYTRRQAAARWIRKNRYVVLTASLVLSAVLAGGARVWMENQVARRNLAQAFLEKSGTAARELRWARAGAYAAAARVQDDTAEARWRAAHRGPVELDPVLRLTLGGPAESLALSPDGKRLAVLVAGRGLLLLDALGGMEVGKIEPEGTPKVLAWSPDGALLAGGTGQVVYVWSATTGEAQMRLDAGALVNDLAFSSDNSRLAVATGNAARIYETADWKLLAHLEGHLGAVNTVAFSHDLKLLVTAGEDGTIRAWSPLPELPGAHVDQRYVRAQGHSPITRAFFVPGGHVVAVSGVDMTVRFFDADALSLLRRINGDNAFTSMAGSAEGLYAALSQDSRVLLVDAATQSAVARLDSEDAASSVAISADGSTVAIANRDGKLRSWKISVGARVLGFPAPKGFGAATALALAPSGKRAAIADAGGHVLLLDVSTGKLERTLELPQGAVSALAWSPGAGKYLAAVGTEEVVSLFEIAGGARTALEGHQGPVRAAAFSPEGKLLATGGSDGTVHLWDVATAAPRATLSASEKPINAVAFSTDGKLLAAAGDDRVIYLYDLATRRQKRQISGAPDAILSVAFSPHASLIASSGNDQAVRTWRVSNGEPRSVWNGHGGHVQAVAFAPDGETLASASIDGTIRLWDVRTGRQVARFERAPAPTAIAFSRDGSMLASAGEKPALQLIEIDDKSSLLKPDPELARQLKKRKLKLDGIELIDDDEALALKVVKRR